MTAWFRSRHPKEELASHVVFIGWHEGLNLAPRRSSYDLSQEDGSTSVEKPRRNALVQLITLQIVASHASCMHSRSSCNEVRTTRFVWDSRSRCEGKNRSFRRKVERTLQTYATGTSEDTRSAVVRSVLQQWTVLRAGCDTSWSGKRVLIGGTCGTHGWCNR